MLEKWFERNIKYGCDVYMIVGIHTVPESSIRISELESRFSEWNASLGAENGRVSVGSPAPGEVVFAVQYRKARFNWFSSRKMERGFLNIRCNRWKVASIGVRTDEIDDEEDDVLEAILGDSISEKDVEGEFFFANNQIITV